MCVKARLESLQANLEKINDKIEKRRTPLGYRREDAEERIDKKKRLQLCDEIARLSRHPQVASMFT